MWGRSKGTVPRMVVQELKRYTRNPISVHSRPFTLSEVEVFTVPSFLASGIPLRTGYFRTRLPTARHAHAAFTTTYPALGRRNRAALGGGVARNRRAPVLGLLRLVATVPR